MSDPIPMLLWCPACHERHIDVGEFATKIHHTHSCQNCGLTWRPAVVPTCGVQFLPGFKNTVAVTPKCDYRMGEGQGRTCTAPIAFECFCSRCVSEGVDGTFHACKDHRDEANYAHVRTYGKRHAEWGTSTGKPR